MDWSHYDTLALAHALRAQTFATILSVSGERRQNLLGVDFPPAHWMSTAAGGVFLTAMMVIAALCMTLHFAVLSCIIEHKCYVDDMVSDTSLHLYFLKALSKTETENNDMKSLGAT